MEALDAAVAASYGWLADISDDEVTATDDELVEGDESLTLNGLVGDTALGSVTLTIEDDDMAISYTLSGSADGHLVKGESYELTATATSAVQADTTVEILRDAAASDPGEDDYSVEPILIEAGETTGTTTLMVTADDLPDGGTGTNRGETLVLFGSVGGIEYRLAPDLVVGDFWQHYPGAARNEPLEPACACHALGRPLRVRHQAQRSRIERDDRNSPRGTLLLCRKERALRQTVFVQCVNEVVAHVEC